MITFKIHKWKVRLIFSDSSADTLLKELLSLGCAFSCLTEVLETFKDSYENRGFTFSNLLKQESIVFIGKHNKLGQLINTIAHESRHLQQHIANYYKLDLNSEEVCYLLGYIVQKIYILYINYFNI